MAETVATGEIENAKKATAAEIDNARRGLSFAMRITGGAGVISVGFFAVATAGVANTPAAITAGTLFLSVPVVMLVRSFITRS